MTNHVIGLARLQSLDQRRDGTVVLEMSTPTDANAIFGVLEPYAPRLHLVGYEATGWSAWLHRELQARGMPMVLLEMHHAARMLEAQRVLTRFKGSDLIKTWGLRLAKTKCHAKARVAVARKLAVVMLRCGVTARPTLATRRANSMTSTPGMRERGGA
ncbi:hypothetical protein [Mesorhizobium sp. B283B1A]|uniref:hypothetical protein n=1 Tax=Mesorhizobium TaxID=68287 RepID=UPI00398D26E5